MLENTEHIIFQLFTVEAIELLLLAGGLLDVLIAVLSTIFDPVDDVTQFVDWFAAFLHFLGLAAEVGLLVVGLLRLAYLYKDRVAELKKEYSLCMMGLGGLRPSLD